MDLAMVIMDFKNSEVYARVKLLGDTELKVPTQFVLKVKKSQKQFYLAYIWKISQFTNSPFFNSKTQNSRFKFVLFHSMKMRLMNNGGIMDGTQLIQLLYAYSNYCMIINNFQQTYVGIKTLRRTD